MKRSPRRPAWVCGDCDISTPIVESEGGIAGLVAGWTPLLARPFEEYGGETNPVLRLHRLCDAMEVLTRFCAVVAWFERALADEEAAREAVRRAAGEQLRRPTFGVWAAVLSSLVDEAAPDRILPTGWVHEQLLPRLGHGDGDVRTEVIALRNLVAHGGGLGHEQAIELLAAHGPPVARLLADSSWLGGLDLGLVEGGEFRALRGERTVLAPVGPALRDWLGAHAGHLVAVRRPPGQPEEAVALWPLVHFDRARMVGPRGVTEAAEPSPLLYLRADRDAVLYTASWGSLPMSRRSDALDDFARLFDPAAERLASGHALPEDFTDEVRAEADRLVGRRAELNQLKSAVKGCTGGVLWLAGQAGIGKSVLVARLARDLSNAPPTQVRVVAYRFRAGDSRCTTVGFVRYVVRELSAWLNEIGGAHVHDTTPRGDLDGLMAQLRQVIGAVASAPTDRGRAPRAILVLDGLDEIVRYDPEFPELIFRHRAPGVVWVCAGRPESGLPERFSPERAEQVFPGGLGGMSEADVREMLVEGAGARKYELLAHDRAEGERIVNPFVRAVEAHAQGLPLYVRFVVEDLVRGEFSCVDPGWLPRGLSAYYEDIIRRLGLGDLQALVSPAMVTLAWSEGPLSREALDELLRWRGLLASGAASAELLDRAMEHLRPLTRLAPTGSQASGRPVLGYMPYHDSLRAHLRESPLTQNASTLAREAYARAAAQIDTFAPGGHLRPYLERHGVGHLADTGRYREALGLCERLQRSRPAQLTAADVQTQARSLFLDLRRCPASGDFPARSLARVIIGAAECNYEILVDGVRLFWSARAAERRAAIDLLVDDRQWAGCFAVATVLGERHLEKPSRRSFDEMVALAGSERHAASEIGLYALKVVATRGPASERGRALAPMLDRPKFIHRAVLGETLLTLALAGERVSDIIAEHRLDQTGWPYLQAAYADCLAVEHLLQGEAGDDQLRATELLRAQLLHDPRVRAEPSLLALVDQFYQLPTRAHLLREGTRALSQSPLLDQLLRVLFGHASWEVREAVGVLVAEVAGARPEVEGLVRLAMRHGDPRVRYASIDAAYAMRGSDGGALLRESFHALGNDAHPWVRGLVGEYLHEWVWWASGDERRRLGEEFRAVLLAELADEDMWTLDVVRYAIVALRDVDPAWAGVRPPPGSLLAGVADWDALGVESFYAQLDAQRGVAGP